MYIMCIAGWRIPKCRDWMYVKDSKVSFRRNHMPSDTKRLSMIISDDLDRLIDDLAKEAGTSRTDVVRRALAVMKAYKSQKDLGRSHLGFVEDAKNLDVEIINVL